MDDTARCPVGRSPRACARVTTRGGGGGGWLVPADARGSVSLSLDSPKENNSWIPQ